MTSPILLDIDQSRRGLVRHEWFRLQKTFVVSVNEKVSFHMEIYRKTRSVLLIISMLYDCAITQCTRHSQGFVERLVFGEEPGVYRPRKDNE